MIENNTKDNGVFEALDENAPEVFIQVNCKNEIFEEDNKFEFLIQDMFLDHFFP